MQEVLFATSEEVPDSDVEHGIEIVQQEGLLIQEVGQADEVFQGLRKADQLLYTDLET